MAIMDEDTGDQVACVFCQSVDHCEHLFACFDVTFSECEGGYAYGKMRQLTRLIESTFLKQLAMDATCQSDSMDTELSELWDYALENYTENDEDVEICGSGLLSFMTDTLMETDCHILQGIREGGSGASSAYTLFYAEDTRSTFDNALEITKDKLRKGFPQLDRQSPLPETYDPEWDSPEAIANFQTRHIRNLHERRRRRDEIIEEIKTEKVVDMFPGKKEVSEESKSEVPEHYVTVTMFKVVIRLDAIEQHYAGGWDAFSTEYGCEEKPPSGLVTLTSMSLADLSHDVDQMIKNSLVQGEHFTTADGSAGAFEECTGIVFTQIIHSWSDREWIAFLE